MNLRLLNCGLALLVSGCAVATQQVPAGSLVRLRMDTPEEFGRPVTGSYQGATRDSVRVQRDSLAAPTSYLRSRVLSLEVGHRGTAKTMGAVLGAAVGVAVVTVVAPAGGDRRRCESKFGDLCGIFFGFYVMDVAHYATGVALGAVVGYLVGSLIPMTHWTRVPLEDLRISVTPLPGGRTGFGAAFSF
ncbi:MAG: hypothetical protein ABSB58_09340 [Gemmatimonadales bacterium]